MLCRPLEREQGFGSQSVQVHACLPSLHIHGFCKHMNMHMHTGTHTPVNPLMDRATSSQLIVGSTDLLRAWTCRRTHKAGANMQNGGYPTALPSRHTDLGM